MWNKIIVSGVPTFTFILECWYCNTHFYKNGADGGLEKTEDQKKMAPERLLALTHKTSVSVNVMRLF